MKPTNKTPFFCLLFGGLCLLLLFSLISAIPAPGQVLYHTEKKAARMNGDSLQVELRHMIYEFSDSLYTIQGEPLPEKVADASALEWLFSDVRFIARTAEVYVYTTRDSQYVKDDVTYTEYLQDALWDVRIEVVKKVPGVNAIQNIADVAISKSKTPPKDTATAKSDYTKRGAEIDSLFATYNISVELPFKPK